MDCSVLTLQNPELKQGCGVSHTFCSVFHHTPGSSAREESGPGITVMALTYGDGYRT